MAAYDKLFHNLYLKTVHDMCKCGLTSCPAVSKTTRRKQYIITTFYSVTHCDTQSTETEKTLTITSAMYNQHYNMLANGMYWNHG